MFQPSFWWFNGDFLTIHSILMTNWNRNLMTFALKDAAGSKAHHPMDVSRLLAGSAALQRRTSVEDLLKI